MASSPFSRSSTRFRARLSNPGSTEPPEYRDDLRAPECGTQPSRSGALAPAATRAAVSTRRGTIRSLASSGIRMALAHRRSAAVRAHPLGRVGDARRLTWRATHVEGVETHRVRSDQMGSAIRCLRGGASLLNNDQLRSGSSATHSAFRAIAMALPVVNDDSVTEKPRVRRRQEDLCWGCPHHHHDDRVAVPFAAPCAVCRSRSSPTNRRRLLSTPVNVGGQGLGRCLPRRSGRRQFAPIGNAGRPHPRPTVAAGRSDEVSITLGGVIHVTSRDVGLRTRDGRLRERSDVHPFDPATHA